MSNHTSGLSRLPLPQYVIYPYFFFSPQISPPVLMFTRDKTKVALQGRQAAYAKRPQYSGLFVLNGTVQVVRGWRLLGLYPVTSYRHTMGEYHGHFSKSWLTE